MCKYHIFLEYIVCYTLLYAIVLPRSLKTTVCIGLPLNLQWFGKTLRDVQCGKKTEILLYSYKLPPASVACL